MSNPAAGLRLQERILPFWQRNVAPLITESGLANMAADKAAAVAGGWLPGLTPRLRWPYRSAPTERVARIAAAARVELPEFFTA